MTITTTSRSVTATGNNATTVWPYAFKVLDEDHLVVSITDTVSMIVTVLVPGTFTVTGVGTDVGGTITYPISGTPLTPTETITIERTVPVIQETDIINEDGFYPEVIETRFDLLTMMIQQIEGGVITTPPAADGEVNALRTPGMTAGAVQLDMPKDGVWLDLKEIKAGAGMAVAQDGTSITLTNTVSGGGGGGGVVDTAFLGPNELGSTIITGITYTVGVSTVLVFLNGTLLPSSAYTALTGTSVTLNTALAKATDIATAIALDGGFGSAANIKVDATAPPTVNDDQANTSGNGEFTVNSHWIDVTNNNVYNCVDSTAGAAVWALLSVKNNKTASSPGINDDIDQGYSVGSIWVNSSTMMAYVCADITNGAAVWYNITAAGSGSGDMLIATYDPTAVGGDAFDMDNMVESATAKIMTDVERTKLASLDQAMVLVGTWDASVGTFPGGGTAQAGATYLVSTGGTVDSEIFTTNDRIVALIDNASTSTFAANWHKMSESNDVLSVGGLTGVVTLAGLNLVTGTDIQAFDAGLLSIAGLTTAANKMIYTTALDTYAVTDLTAAGRALLDDADAAAQVATLGLKKINVAVSAVPGVTNDDTEGYEEGSLWVNEATDMCYICANNATGAAVWIDITAGAGGGISNVSEDATPDLGGNLSGLSTHNINSITALSMLEAAAAPIADAATFGQFWVKNDAPNKPHFEDDAGNDSQIVLLADANDWGQHQYSTPVALTSTSGTATWDMAADQNALFDVTENVTTFNMNNHINGAVYTMEFRQDTVARTISWPLAVKWPGGTAPTLSTGSDDVDVFTFRSDGTNLQGFIAGQAHA